MLRATRQARSVPLLVRGAARKAAHKSNPSPEAAIPKSGEEPGASRTTTTEQEDTGWTPSERWAVPPNEVRKRTMWESWAALPANQRLAISLGIFTGSEHMQNYGGVRPNGLAQVQPAGVLGLPHFRGASWVFIYITYSEYHTHQVSGYRR
ncbi:unnamed protein product [Peniophora sp. CBMAI 1063]|nr:unnamed protein product [Peniophora sp. CBMAI 1063]